MKGQVQGYRNQTQELVAQMSEDNQTYFDNLQSYVLLATFFKDEQTICEQIYNMTVDLRDAEQDGLTAEDFFGKDAKGMADAIIANSPAIGLGELVKLTVLVGVILSFYRILQDFSSSPLLSLSPFVYLSYFIYGSIGVYLIFQCLSRMVYSRRTWIWSGLIGVITVALFALAQFSKNWLGAVGLVVLPAPWDSLLVFAVSLLYMLWAVRDRAFRYLIYPILAFLAVGILRRLLDGVQPNNAWLHTGLPIVIIGLGVGLFYWQLIRQSKKSDK